MPRAASELKDAAPSQLLWNFVSARAVPTMLVNMGAGGYG